MGKLSLAEIKEKFLPGVDLTDYRMFLYGEDGSCTALTNNTFTLIPSERDLSLQYFNDG